MVPSIYFQSATFSDGTTIEFGDRDIVLFVGPNNCGKSTALRDLYSSFTNDDARKVVTAPKVKAIGSVEEIRSLTSSIGTKTEGSSKSQVSGDWGTLDIEPLVHQWGRHSSNPRTHEYASRLFVRWLNTSKRLEYSNPVNSFDALREHPVHPIQRMYRSSNAEVAISDQFRTAFDLDLVVNRLSGNKIPLHVGLRPVPQDREHSFSDRFARAIDNLPTLASQGDGMRSYATILLSLAAGTHSIILIDEPETFLHPPQVRSLAAFLAVGNPSGQLFLSTHSGDLLRGILDVASDRVRVVRITRSEDKNPVSDLKPELVAAIWKDPSLRHSNILDAVFHKGAVVCESDSDCRFYSSIASSIGLGRDVLYSHCGTKDRLHVAAQALKALKVPVAVIADIDVLNDEAKVKRLVESLGGEWPRFRPDWAVVTSAIRDSGPQWKREDVQREIAKAMSQEKGVFLSQVGRDAITAALRASSPWSMLKRAGVDALPGGEASVSCRRLINQLAAIGLHVVPVGELEGFCRAVGGHGPKWVIEVLQKQLDVDPALGEARTFVSGVLKSIA